MLVAGFGQAGGALLLVELEIFRAEFWYQLVDGVVEIRTVVGRAGNDQRRARLVDQDRIHLIDDAIGMAALNHLVQLVFHVVAQIVEAEFVIGAVGDVAGIGLGALGVAQFVDDDADGQAEEIIDAPHVFRVAAGEVVIDRDDMDAVSGQRVEVTGQRRDQGLAFARAHLGDGALVQHHAADQLHIEMTLADGALGRLAHGGESRNEKIVEFDARGELGAEIRRCGRAGPRRTGRRFPARAR